MALGIGSIAQKISSRKDVQKMDNQNNQNGYTNFNNYQPTPDQNAQQPVNPQGQPVQMPYQPVQMPYQTAVQPEQKNKSKVLLYMIY